MQPSWSTKCPLKMQLPFLPQCLSSSCSPCQECSSFCLFPCFFKEITLFLFNYSCLHLPSTIPAPSQIHLPPVLPPLPLGFVHLSFIVVSENLTPIIPSQFPSGYCQFVLNFNVSGYILLACLFCQLGPVKGGIIWYLSLTTWLFSLSIMLSSSIHAVTKSRSSFLRCSVV